MKLRIKTVCFFYVILLLLGSCKIFQFSSQKEETQKNYYMPDECSENEAAYFTNNQHLHFIGKK